MQTEKQRNWRK